MGRRIESAAGLLLALSILAGPLAAASAQEAAPAEEASATDEQSEEAAAAGAPAEENSEPAVPEPAEPAVPEPAVPEHLSEEELREALRVTPRPVRFSAAPEAEERRPRERIGSVTAVAGAEVRIALERAAPLPLEALLFIGDERSWVVRREGQVAWARLDLNARVHVGDEVIDSGRDGRSSLLPSVAYEAFELAARVRVVFPFRQLGFAGLYDLRASYLFDPGLRVGLELAPFVFGASDRPDPAAMNLHAFVTFASRWIEAGLGIGFATRQPPSRVSWDPAISRNPYDHGRFSLQERLRLGSPDGLSIGIRVAETFDGSDWDIGDVQGDVRILLDSGVWLYGAGGGGNTGMFFGEGGVRLLVERDGAMGSLFVLLTGGLAVLQVPGNDHFGPLLGVGVDWRLR